MDRRPAHPCNRRTAPRHCPGASGLWLVLVLGLLPHAASGCSDRSPANLSADDRAANPVTPGDDPAPAGKRGVWTDDEIIRDAIDCRKWAIGRLDAVAGVLRARLKSLSARLDALSAKHERFIINMTDVDRFFQRFRTARRRAEDEGRWPLKLGEKLYYDEDKARVVHDRIQAYLDDRRPVLDAYNRRAEVEESQRKALETELKQVERLRERITLDFERVSLSQEIDDLGRLRRTCIEVTRLADPAAEAAPAPAPLVTGNDPQVMELDDLVK
jgi:hypothetical protein